MGGQNLLPSNKFQIKTPSLQLTRIRQWLMVRLLRMHTLAFKTKFVRPRTMSSPKSAASSTVFWQRQSRKHTLLREKATKLEELRHDLFCDDRDPFVTSSGAEDGLLTIMKCVLHHELN